MSWCRWSTDSFRCDLYIYDSVGDFVAVMVAGRRKWFCLPEPNGLTRKSGKWEVKTGIHWWLYRIGKWIHRTTYNLTPWRDIKWKGGESLQFTDMNQLAEWLLEARRNGLRFPDRVWGCLTESVVDSSYQMEGSSENGSERQA